MVLLYAEMLATSFVKVIRKTFATCIYFRAVTISCLKLATKVFKFEVTGEKGQKFMAK